MTAFHRGDVVVRLYFRSRQNRHTGLFHEIQGGQLVTHRAYGLGRRTHPDHPGFLHRRGEGRILRKKSVSGVNGVGAGPLACRQYFLHVEIRLAR